MASNGTEPADQSHGTSDGSPPEATNSTQSGPTGMLGYSLTVNSSGTHDSDI